MSRSVKTNLLIITPSGGDSAVLERELSAVVLDREQRLLRFEGASVLRNQVPEVKLC